MSQTASTARGGEFATGRRGGVDRWERAFIAQKRGQGVSFAAIANMLGRAVADVRAAFPVEPEPEPPAEISIPESLMAETARRTAAEHGLTLRDLIGARMLGPVVRARHQAFWRVYELRKANGRRRYSTTQIGKFFGGRDHTAVLAGIERHAERMAAGEISA